MFAGKILKRMMANREDTSQSSYEAMDKPLSLNFSMWRIRATFAGFLRGIYKMMFVKQNMNRA